ncbi:MAG TPA: hypothetical protein VMT76_06955 [Puia sp.]|nr:hypothetical protein [Puia sp.]
MKTFMHTTFVIFIVIFFFNSCYKESNYDPQNLAKKDSSNIQIWGGGNSIPADSVSLIKIAIVFPYDADSSKCVVNLTTDLGTFVESGSNSISLAAKNNIDSAKKVAFATLKSGSQIGVAHIQCTLYSFTKTITDTFFNSYPDFINLSASSLSIKPSNGADGEITFSCKIYKSQGVPSQKNLVGITVSDTNNVAIGSFRVKNPLSDNSGNSQFVYVLGDSIANRRASQYYGRLTAVATDTNSMMTPIHATIQFISSH